jgi:hypothetical protein
VQAFDGERTKLVIAANRDVQRRCHPFAPFVEDIASC